MHLILVIIVAKLRFANEYVMLIMLNLMMMISPSKTEV